MQGDELRVLVKYTIRLENNPDGAVADFSIRETRELLSELSGTRAEDLFGGIQGDTANQQD
jgi:hypothetical protein